MRSFLFGSGEARTKLAPARLGVGWGYSRANINRRAIDVDGKATLGLNPDGVQAHGIEINFIFPG